MTLDKLVSIIAEPLRMQETWFCLSFEREKEKKSVYMNKKAYDIRKQKMET